VSAGRIIRIATRRSQLALAQAYWVKARLEAIEPGLTVELKEYVTRGDQIQNVPLQQVGGKGLFTKEIEDALLANEADVAVHSLKDLPAELPPGLALAAVPEREDPRDVVVLRGEGRGAWDERDALSSLPEGALIGSSSFRRSAQLRHTRPDLRVESVRGNVDTRLRKLDEGQYDAIILAAAGLKRLGREDRISHYLPVEVCTPAPGQGALGLQSREDDARVGKLLQRLEHTDTRACVAAERALMEALGGGCSVPLGGLATVEAPDRIRVIAVVALPDGSQLLRTSIVGPLSDPIAAGRAAAEKLLARGARSILDRGRT